jgi:hypothetical protein
MDIFLKNSPLWVKYAIMVIGLVLWIIGNYSGTKLTSADQFENGATFNLKAKIEQSDIQVTKEAINSVEGLKAKAFGKYYVLTYDLDGQKRALISPKPLFGKTIQSNMVVIKRSKAPLIDAAVAEYEATQADNPLGEYVLYMNQSSLTSIGIILVYWGMFLIVWEIFRILKPRKQFS